MPAPQNIGLFLTDIADNNVKKKLKRKLINWD